MMDLFDKDTKDAVDNNSQENILFLLKKLIHSLSAGLFLNRILG